MEKVSKKDIQNDSYNPRELQMILDLQDRVENDEHKIKFLMDRLFEQNIIMLVVIIIVFILFHCSVTS